jgi:acyl CoA:acetate/3-ketoacid CoA transferase beta subunit
MNGVGGGGIPDSPASLAELCIVACAEAWRGDGAILASPVGVIPTLAARLAQCTFAPDLMVTDGEANLTVLVDGRVIQEGWLPYRYVLSPQVASGLRHMMMGAAQLDKYGNQNISCIGDWTRPKAQLLGSRGAPGNSVNHPISYWVPRHTPRVFVEQVDFVSGIGYDRARTLGARVAAFHEVRRVVTNLAVLDFAGPGDSMRLQSVHPGVSVSDVVQATGFALAIPDQVAETTLPTASELALIREQLDPACARDRELS